MNSSRDMDGCERFNIDNVYGDICATDKDVCKDRGGKVAVLLPGIGCPNTSFLEIMRYCRERTLRCIALNISGHGDRGINRKSLHTTSVEDGVNDVVATVKWAEEELEAEKLSIFAFSLGARYEVECLLRRQRERGDGTTGIDKKGFIAPTLSTLMPSMRVLCNNPVAYAKGLVPFRSDKIMRSAPKLFFDEYDENSDRERLMHALLPTSARMYMKTMASGLLIPHASKQIEGPADVLIAKNDRVVRESDSANNVGKYFENDSRIRRFKSSHCGMLHNEEVAEALCKTVLGES